MNHMAQLVELPNLNEYDLSSLRIGRSIIHLHFLRRRLTTGKMKKYIPYMSLPKMYRVEAAGLKKVPVILKKLWFLWIFEILGNFVKILI